MYSDLFEQINKVQYRPESIQIKELLEKTWSRIALATCASKASAMYPHLCDLNELARAELSADEVRSAVYESVADCFSVSYPHVVEMWQDLTIDEQDIYLQEVFPNNGVYTI